MYLYSAQQFDRKIALIFDIENNYQQMLKQVKVLNNIITELSNVNLLVLNGKSLPVGYQANSQTLLDGDSLVRGVNGRGVLRNNPDSSEINKTAEELVTTIESRGTASHTTKLAQTKVGTLTTRARSGDYFGKQGAISVASNYDLAEIIEGTQSGDQKVVSLRPKT